MVYDFDEYSRPLWIYLIYIGAYLFIYLASLIYIYNKSIYKKQRKIVLAFFIVFYCIFAVYYCLGSDYFRYRNLVDIADGTTTIARQEALYQKLAYYVNGDYELFRLIIWGGAIILTSISSRFMKIPVLATLLIWFVLFYDRVCYARVSLAMSIFFLGCIISILCKKKHFFFSLIGVAICFLSIYFHRSMAIAVMAIPVIFFRLTRRNLIIYMLFLIIAGIQIIAIVNSNPDFLMDDLSDKMEKYNNAIESGRWERHGIKNYLSSIVGYSLFYIPAIIMLYKILSKKYYIPRKMMDLFGVTITIILIATSFSLFFGFNNAYFYRVLFFTAAPLSMFIVYMYQEKMIGRKLLLFFLTYSVLYHMLYLRTTMLVNGLINN